MDDAISLICGMTQGKDSIQQNAVPKELLCK